MATCISLEQSLGDVSLVSDDDEYVTLAGLLLAQHEGLPKVARSSSSATSASRSARCRIAASNSCALHAVTARNCNRCLSGGCRCRRYCSSCCRTRRERISVRDLFAALGDRALAALLFVFAVPTSFQVPVCHGSGRAAAVPVGTDALWS